MKHRWLQSLACAALAMLATTTSPPGTARAACDNERVQGEMTAFRRAHPPPPPFVKEAWVEYNRALFSASAAWTSACPDDPSAWSARFAAVQQIDGVPRAEVVAAVTTYLRLSEGLEEGAFFEAAGAYLRHGISTDDVEQWIAGGESRAKDQEAGLWRAWALRARARLLRGAVDEADGAVSKLGNLLTAAGDASPSNAAQRRERNARSSEYWMLRGLVATKRGLSADAFAFFKRALEHDPGNGDVERQAADAWKAVGGTAEGLTALKGLRGGAESKGVAAWESRDEPLPPFELVDLQGRRWTSQALRGTVLLINMWATWCGPCKIELPYVERLHQRLAGRSDIRVLTLNADAKPEYPRAFVAEQKLTFPTLLALDYVRQVTGGEILLPQSWIVDAEGRVRLAAAGFSTKHGDEWVAETLASLESFAKPSTRASRLFP